MIDPEMLAAILKELGYLDEDDENKGSKSELEDFNQINSKRPEENISEDKE